MQYETNDARRPFHVVFIDFHLYLDLAPFVRVMSRGIIENICASPVSAIILVA